MSKKKNILNYILYRNLFSLNKMYLFVLEVTYVHGCSLYLQIRPCFHHTINYIICNNSLLPTLLI